MSAEENEDQEIKIRDRRRLSPETGELRKEGEGSEVSSPPSSTEQAETKAESAPASTSQPEVTFPGFILGLSSQVMMYLGEVPDPQGEGPMKDLVAARHLIDIIGLLKDKTTGNLEKDEEQLIEHILFDLRTKYVESTKNN